MDEPRWRAPGLVPNPERPGELWALLSETGSLTERLRRTCGSSFNVCVLQECETTLDPATMALVEATSSTAWVREVYLCCADTPWVYARTLMPQDIISSSSQPWLRELHSRALGDALSSRGGIRRSALTVAQVNARHSLFRQASASHPSPPENLWARRSLVAVGGGYLAIQECFLPELGARSR